MRLRAPTVVAAHAHLPVIEVYSHVSREGKLVRVRCLLQLVHSERPRARAEQRHAHGEQPCARFVRERDPFLGAAFWAAGFLATAFLAAVFLAGFLATADLSVFLAAAFLATGFLPAAFLVAGFLAVFFSAGLLAASFLTADFLAVGFLIVRSCLGVAVRIAFAIVAPIVLSAIFGRQVTWTVAFALEPGIAAWAVAALAFGSLRNLARLAWLKGPR